MARPQRYDRFGRPNPRGHFIKRRPPGGKRRTVLARAPRREPLRRLPVPTPDGRYTRVAIRDPREKSILGRYWNAVRQYVETGDDTQLRRLERERKTVDVSGRRHRLVFDRAVLRQGARRGALAIDDYGS